MFESSSHAGRVSRSSTTVSTDPGEIRPAWTLEPDEDDTDDTGGTERPDGPDHGEPEPDGDRDRPRSRHAVDLTDDPPF